MLGDAEPAPSTKRIPVQPRAGFMIIPEVVETIAAVPYDIIKHGMV